MVEATTLGFPSSMLKTAQTLIDRHQPSLRPDGSNAGTQTWRDLLFLHWPIDANVIAASLPKLLQVDTFSGQAYLGLVPFKMRKIRPSWLPRSLAFNFLETNLRTYVLHHDRPGVYFFSLDANSRLAVAAARAGWSLPYHFAKMTDQKSSAETAPSPHAVQHAYSSHRPGQATGSVDVEFSVDPDRSVSQLGTLEHFLFERYLLFVEKRNTIYAGQVHHEPYQVQQAEVTRINQTLTDAAGIELANTKPSLAHYCAGVDVEVFAIQPEPEIRDR